jgi:acyl carrier protein
VVKKGNREESRFSFSLAVALTVWGEKGCPSHPGAYMGTTVGKTDRIREIVLELAEIEEVDLSETSLFKEDLGLASLTVIEIQAAIEREFNLVIDEQQSVLMVNLAAVREVFAEARRCAAAPHIAG